MIVKPRLHTKWHTVWTKIADLRHFEQLSQQSSHFRNKSKLFFGNFCLTKKKMSTNKPEMKEKRNEKTGWRGTGFNLANMILGAGALAMPEAFAKGGIVSGTLLLILMCVCGHFTSVLLVKCAIRIGVDSYEKLTEKILGAPGYLFLCVLCIVINVGAAVQFPFISVHYSNRIARHSASH